MNVALITGRLGKDPEIRNTETVKIASFPVATSKKWKDKSGQKQEKTTWHNIVIFGKLSDVAENYLKKGDMVSIVGEINTDEYEKNGEKRYSTKIIANQLEMHGSSGEKKENNKPDNSGFDDDSNTLPF